MNRTKEQYAEDISSCARERWFKNHTVKVTTFESTENASTITVVDFRQPGTINYAVRYVFDGHCIYVSGDLGCAVFNCTWKPTPTGKQYHSMWYMFEKLAASENANWDFETEVCKATLANMLLEANPEGDHTCYPEHWGFDEVTIYHALCDAADRSSSVNEWVHELYEVMECYDITRLDGDYWEWIYDAGDIMPNRIVGIITGLQIVSEKLNKKEEQTDD